MNERPNELHLKLAQQIVSYIRMVPLSKGHHLTEQSLQEVLGISRGPIRAALSYLAERGVLEKRANRGFFLLEVKPDTDLAVDMTNADDEQTYLTIAAERLSGDLPEIVTESELMRRYALSRNRLVRVLRRIASEGWLERRSGHGWSFLPMIDSVHAYQESYYLRRIIEPAGILAPGFTIDRKALLNLETQQSFVHDEGYLTLSQIELFEINSLFHESVAQMSGNRFILTTVYRQNQLRRLVEYRQYLDRSRTRRQCAEHVRIIAKLLSGNLEQAAVLMTKHLTSAVKEKARPEVFAGIGSGISRAMI